MNDVYYTTLAAQSEALAIIGAKIQK